MEWNYEREKSPKGLLIFTSDGRFSQIHVGDVPRIASNNRLTGTPEEYGAIMRGSLSVFGTYTVDEEKRTVTYKIVSSSFPNWGRGANAHDRQAHGRGVRQHQSERRRRPRLGVEFLQEDEVEPAPFPGTRAGV